MLLLLALLLLLLVVVVVVLVLVLVLMEVVATAAALGAVRPLTMMPAMAARSACEASSPCWCCWSSSW